MKIKVCGLRDPNNIQNILNLGVEYVGFIFYQRSKRHAEHETLAKWLTENDHQFSSTARVGIFVNAGMDTILNTVHDYHLDYVQLHGAESPGYCRELQLLWSVSTLRKAKIIKAFSVDTDFDFRSTNDYADTCSLFVFDTGGQQTHGGTGVKWDWQKLAEYQGATPFLLSGGIGPDDARRVKLVQHPQLAGVDLNSKFEVEPGIKDIDLLRDFTQSIKQ
jgi:phosphoribosylanthranilate isomerase